MMAAPSHYRLQIFLPPEMRKALRSLAVKQDTSMQKLVTQVLFDYLKHYPEGAHLPPLTDEE